MHLHDSGENIPVLRKGKALYRLKAREGLEAKLGKITETILPVIGKRLLSMPYIPVMGIASCLIPRIIIASA